MNPKYQESKDSKFKSKDSKFFKTILLQFFLKGYIKLSSADSILSTDLINAKFDSINWSEFNKQLLYEYPRGGGEKSTLETMAKFINRFCFKNTINISADEVSFKF